MKKRVASGLVVLVAAVLGDTVVGPILFGRGVELRLTTVTVALLGMQHGRWWGLAAGWCAGLLLAALSTAPLGIYLLSLGCAGFLAGLLSSLSALRVPVLDAALLLGILVFEDALSGIAAYGFCGAHWHPAVWGILLTLLVTLAAIPRRRERPAD